MIPESENISVEFKSAQVRPESVARAMVAFSNTYGGTLYIGVEDDGSVSGLDEGRKWDEWAANIARNAINPAISPKISVELEGEKRILRIDVEKGKNKPYQTLGDGKYWIRVASTVRIATQQELSRLFQAAGMLHYDISPVEGSCMDDLNERRLISYFKNIYKIDYIAEADKPRLLKNASLLAELDGKDVATVGGLLQFSFFADRFLPQATISIAVIKGTDISDDVVQKKEIAGPLTDQIDAAVSFMRLFTPEPLVVKDSPRREDTLAIPLDVMRETVVNAVAHRDYSILTRKIHIYIYSDRIEVQSPGRLANTLSLEMLPYGNSAPRNIFLVKLLDNMNYIDGLGRGIPLIVRKMGKRVHFTENGELFCVRLDFA